MSRARQSRPGRIPVSYMLAPATVARLAQLSHACDLSRGRLVDLAIAAIEPCHVCSGTGSDSTTATCATCAGVGIEGTRS